MRYRRLGTTDIEVSEFSLGCWSLGGPSWYFGEPTGWPAADEEEMTGAIRLALDSGVNHFDTADCYGEGESERMLGRIFRCLGIDDEKVIVATKIGYINGSAAHPYEPAHIRHQCEQSLINLGRDHIDLLYFHHPKFGENDCMLEGAIEAVSELVSSGKVRHVCLSAYSEADFERLVPVMRPPVIQSFGNLLDDRFIAPNSRVSNLMTEYNASFVAFSPLAHGLLLGKYSAGSIPSFEDGDHRGVNENFLPERIKALSDKMSTLKAKYGDDPATLSSVAQRFVLAHSNVACVITGFRSRQQVETNLRAMDFHLSPEEVDSLRELFADLVFE